jgi:hypothetical protein
MNLEKMLQKLKQLNIKIQANELALEDSLEEYKRNPDPLTKMIIDDLIMRNGFKKAERDDLQDLYEEENSKYYEPRHRLES